MRGVLVTMLGLVGCDQVFALERPVETNVWFKKRIALSPLGDTLSDFPVAIVVDDPDLAAHVIDGVIAFTADDGTRLSHEIESYDNGALAAWVRVPKLSPGTAIEMHYGALPAELAAEMPGADVWGLEYGAVWHFAGTNLGEVRDSTNNGNDLEQSVANRQASNSPGIVGPARRMDGDTDTALADLYVASDRDSLDPGILTSFTYAIWVNTELFVGQSDMPMYKGGQCATCQGYDFELGQGGWFIQVSDGAGTEVDRVVLSSTQAETRLGRWSHVVGVVDRDAKDLSFYVDGNLVGRDPLGEKDLANASDLTISNSTSLEAVFRGVVDEGRIYHGVLTQDWIQAEYRNLSDRERFVVIGAEQVVQ